MTQFNLQELEKKLLELEWKLSALNPTLRPSLLPRGLFSQLHEMSPRAFIEDIHADIRACERENLGSRELFLAKRIAQKIDVLVNLCRIQAKKEKPDLTMAGVQALKNRQAWIQEMESHVTRLSAQQDVLFDKREDAVKNGDTELALSVGRELGILEKKIYAIKEKIKQR